MTETLVPLLAVSNGPINQNSCPVTPPNGPATPPNGSVTTPNGILKTGEGMYKRESTININVGGRKAKLEVEMVKKRLPDSKLGVFCSKDHAGRISEADAYFENLNEYYFERSPVIFEYVVDYYITGKLHRPMDICPIRLRYELEYWRIPTMYMSPCCQLEENNNVRSKMDKQSKNGKSIPEFDDVWMGPLRKKIYQLLENPRSSSAAKVVSILSASFVLLSLLGLILSSMPEFQDEHRDPLFLLSWLENICMIYFIIEYVSRFLVNPRKKKFMKSWLNNIDLCTIIPFLIESLEELPILNKVRGAMLVMRVMRVSRVARIFKLARYSTGLRAFGETMKKSAAELSMLGMFLVTGIMLFSTAIYFFERDEPNSKFYSIPAACWWCVITMTTVGYGDLVPVTAGGKVVAAVASVCGIIVLAFPISMIIDKFAESTSGWGNGEEESGGSVRRKQNKQQTKRYLF